MWAVESPILFPFLLFSPISFTLAACVPAQPLYIQPNSSLRNCLHGYRRAYLISVPLHGNRCPIKMLARLQGAQRDFLGWGKLSLQLFLILMKWDYGIMNPHCLLGMIYNKDLYLADVEHLHGQTNHSFWSGRTARDFRVNKASLPSLLQGSKGQGTGVDMPVCKYRPTIRVCYWINITYVLYSQIVCFYLRHSWSLPRTSSSRQQKQWRHSAAQMRFLKSQAFHSFPFEVSQWIKGLFKPIWQVIWFFWGHWK